jgi:hypothetical protein
MERQTWLQRNKVPVVVVTLVVMLIALPLISNYWLAPLIFEQNRQAGENIAKDTINKEKALKEYEEFRTLWYDIQSAREQLNNYQQEEETFHETYGDDPSEWSRSAEERHGRIHERITGQRNQVSSLVAEYNAKQDTATEAIFQCGLPYNIDEKLYIGDATGVEYTSSEAADKTPPEDGAECKFAQDPSESGASNSTAMVMP